MRGSTLLAAALLAAATATANADTVAPRTPFNYTFPDGIKGFALQGSLPSTSGGPVINPIVLVGFNPQPEPPGAPPPTTLSLGDRTSPLLDNLVPASDYEFILSFVNLYPPGPCHNAFDMPGTDGVTSMHCSAAFGDGSVDIAATLQFSGPGPGPGGVVSWVAFNPQPDPPGDVAAYDVGFRGDANVRLTLTVNNEPVSFVLAPEPGTLAVLGGGLIALAAARRRSNG